MVNFSTWTPDCDSLSPALFYLFISSDASICSATAFPSLGKSDHVVVSVFIDLPSNLQWDAQLHHIAILVLIGMLFVIIWEIFHWRIFLNSVFLLLLVNFVSGFRFELMYVSLIVSIRSSLTHLHGYQLLVLLSKFIEITFCLYQQNKSSKSKIKFRQASKTKESITSQKLGSRNLPIVFSTKVNLLYCLNSMDQRCCLLHLIKQNCFLITFLRTLILKTQVSLYLFYLVKLIWNCMQSNVYKTTTLATTQIWSSWTGSYPVKYLYKTTTNN